MNSKSKKNKISLFTAVILAGTLLSGCASQIPEMDDEQQRLIGEYAAITMLKYDANSRSRLVNRAFIRDKVETAEEEGNTNQEEQHGMNPVENTPVINNGEVSYTQQYASLTEFLGLPSGVSIVYKGMDTADSYAPQGDEGSYFSLDASEGKKLVILTFEISNNSGTAQPVDIFGRGAVFKVTVNGSLTRTALMTMLDTDLATYMGTIENGTSEAAVLLVEVDGTMDVGSLSLNVKDSSGSYSEALQ